MLHLLCGTGEATAALAELGAVATGFDPRHASLEAARERWPKILWVDGDLQDIRRPLGRRKFDLVYSGEGVLDRVDDLNGWAAGIAAVLKPGGELLVFDDHPVADCVDGLLRWGRQLLPRPVRPEPPVAARPGRQRARARGNPGAGARGVPGRNVTPPPRPRVPATFLLYARRAT